MQVKIYSGKQQIGKVQGNITDSPQELIRQWCWNNNVTIVGLNYQICT